MPDTLFIGILAIGLALLFLLWLRTALLTQEIFKRLAQLENPIERATDQGEEPSSEDPETHDRVEKLLDDVVTAAPDKMRRYQRFYGLVRLWSQAHLVALRRACNICIICIHFPSDSNL